MELGMFMMPLHPPGTDYTASISGDLDQITTLDRLGYREAWIGEHFTSEWENIPAPDIFIAAALERTTNIILGTGVTCMPNHNPFVLAHRIAQLDHMARGRFQWGIGTGSFPGDMIVFGYDEDGKDQRAMTIKSVDAVLDLWTDPEPGHYVNEFFEYHVPEIQSDVGVKVFLKPYQKPHPPIGVAGITPNSSTLGMAGARGWLPMSINLVPTPILVTHWEAFEQGAVKAGRQPDRRDWRISREVFVAETNDEALAEARTGTMRRDYEDYVFPILAKNNLLSLLKLDPEMPDTAVDVDYMIENVWIVGGPEEVAKKLRQLHEDVGGFGVLLTMGHEWSPRDVWENSFRLLKDEVQPMLLDLS